MSLTVNVHAEKFVAAAKDFTYDNDGKFSNNPFVTLEITGYETYTAGYFGNEPAKVTRTSGGVTLFLKTAEDAERIINAAQEALRDLRNLELEKKIYETLKEEEAKFQEPGDPVLEKLLAEEERRLQGGLDTWEF